MTDKRMDTDFLLRRALGNIEAPDDGLLRQVKATMEKEQDMRTNKMTKRIITLALAAALILALSVTAYAVLDAGDWFKSWFAGQADSELTDGQQAYIENGAAIIGQSVTQNDWTVTLDSIFADRYCYYAKLNIQAPEGTVLEDGYYFTVEMLSSTDPKRMTDFFVYGIDDTVIDDGDGEDNTASLLIKLDMAIPMRELEVDYSYPMVLTLVDLCQEWDIPVAEGTWEFEFTVPEPSFAEVELLSEPVTCSARRYVVVYKDTGEPLDPYSPEGWDNPEALDTVEQWVDVEVTSIRLAAMSATATYMYTGQAPAPILSLPDLEVTITNGSTVTSRTGGCSWDEQTGVCLADFEFTAPLDLSQVESIRLRGNIIPMPE